MSIVHALAPASVPQTDGAHVPVADTSRMPRIDGARAPVHFVANGRAGAGGVGLRDRLSAHPALAGRSVRWHLPGRPRDLAQAAFAAARTAQRNGGIVVGAGGDGTINAVAQAAWALDVPLGVIAQGTFNFFGRQHGLAQDAEQALTEIIDTLHEGALRSVRVGLVNDHVFLVNASLGLYPRLLAEREAATRRWGRSRTVVLAAAAASLLQPASTHRLQLLDGSRGAPAAKQMIQISTLFVGANRLQLETVGLAQDDAVGRGALAAVTLAPQTRLQTLRMLWHALRGRLADDDNVTSFACTRLEVLAAGWRPSTRIRVAFDGETSWMRLPVRFQVAERPLWLVAPPRHTEATHDAALTREAA